MKHYDCYCSQVVKIHLFHKTKKLLYTIRSRFLRFALPWTQNDRRKHLIAYVCDILRVCMQRFDTLSAVWLDWRLARRPEHSNKMTNTNQSIFLLVSPSIISISPKKLIIKLLIKYR